MAASVEITRAVGRRCRIIHADFLGSRNELVTLSRIANTRFLSLNQQ